MLQQITQETLERAQQAVLAAIRDPKLVRAIDTSVGLRGITLEAPAKQLVPLMAPFRQKIGRKSQPGSNAVQWKSITGLGVTTKFSTTESAAANPFTYTKVDKSAGFKVVGRRGKVTREARAESEGWDDVLARETRNTLLLSMKEEEECILGGNITALSAPAAPTVAVIDAGGTVAAQAGGYDVTIIALTLMAANRITIDRPGAFGASAAPINADAPLAGTARYATAALANPAQDGWSAASAATTSAATAGGNDALRITWSPVNGAAAYAVFVIVAGGAETLECIVTQCQVTLTSLAGGGVAFNAANLAGNSADANIFNGIVPLTFADASAYKKNLAGKLTVAGNELVEIQDMFQDRWDAMKCDDYSLLIGGNDSRTITRLMSSASGGPTIMVNPTEQGRTQITQGYHVGAVINSVTGRVCPVNVLPWLRSGMIIAVPNSIPYPDSEVPAPFEMATAYDWERIDYAMTVSGGPVNEFETREYAVLKDYFTAGVGIIHNIYFA